MSLILRDWHSGEKHSFPDNQCCECCGQQHVPSEGMVGRNTRLLLDHTWDLNGTYILTILCGGCNVQKGALPYIPRGIDECWYPGMLIGQTSPKPLPGQCARLAMSSAECAPPRPNRRFRSLADERRATAETVICLNHPRRERVTA